MNRLASISILAVALAGPAVAQAPGIVTMEYSPGGAVMRHTNEAEAKAACVAAKGAFSTLAAGKFRCTTGAAPPPANAKTPAVIPVTPAPAVKTPPVVLVSPAPAPKTPPIVPVTPAPVKRY